MSAFEIIGGLVSLIAFIWVTYNAWTTPSMSTGMKVVWTIAALFLSVITAIVFYFVEYRKRATV